MADLPFKSPCPVYRRYLCAGQYLKTNKHTLNAAAVALPVLVQFLVVLMLMGQCQ